MRNQCMAHRGWSGAAPENTLAAIGMALDHPGVDAIEIDVQLTRDGVPVVIHDFTLERTTTGSGLVMQHTYEELRQLDAGSWFDPKYAAQRIPSLEEVLVVSRGKKRLNIELKQAANRYRGLEEKVVSLIRRRGMQEQVVVTSFDHLSVQKVKQLAPELTVGPIIHGLPVLLRNQVAELGAGIVSLAYPYLSAELAEEVVSWGVELIAWTIDHPDHMRMVAQWHEAIQICTNYPDRWFQVAGIEDSA
ncbi:glycerophosphodiester phosphodiesterase [Brevibacillus humidisoli]|uniref:glycerophosphodiester phosphodiesterase n=1 Tax=Brevibacillus humidisoli TaxID=2895522 RepID=UPI001E29565D|nr:glycerophosphodiester phosphodiesterase family protein [Brevibacillus humidisoli]UFJ42710.1 glycerophosphodiester phosphodiesterase [Brevibacillus humidisoli]